jgi:arsenate reductase
VSERKRVLFLCTGNSARSQIAEGWLRHRAGDQFEAFSAGTEPRSTINPLAIKVMDVVGVNIAAQHPKGLEPFVNEPWDFVITVCDRARESCPIFPRREEQIHWSFRDPAEATGDEDQRLQVFRQVRDEITRRIDLFVAAHPRRALEESSR